MSGVFLPGLLCATLVAFGLNAILRRALAWAGAYRFVWHRPLFDLAMYILLLGAVVWAGSAAGWE